MAAAVLSLPGTLLGGTAVNDGCVPVHTDLQRTKFNGLGSSRPGLQIVKDIGLCESGSIESDADPIIGNDAVRRGSVLLDRCLNPVLFHLDDRQFHCRRALCAAAAWHRREFKRHEVTQDRETADCKEPPHLRSISPCAPSGLGSTRSGPDQVASPVQHSSRASAAANCWLASHTEMSADMISRRGHVGDGKPDRENNKCQKDQCSKQQAELRVLMAQPGP